MATILKIFFCIFHPESDILGHYIFQGQWDQKNKFKKNPPDLFFNPHFLQETSASFYHLSFSSRVSKTIIVAQKRKIIMVLSNNFSIDPCKVIALNLLCLIFGIISNCDSYCSLSLKCNIGKCAFR